MKYYLSLLIIFLVVGCASNVSPENLTLLNGYWEIEKVTFANGNTKNFPINTTIDFIQLKEMKGFRKKMTPKFDGSFTTSNDAEFFTIKNTQDYYEFYYKNKMSEWKEKINSISKNNFSVTNSDTITYTYKRFQPIHIEEE